MKTLIILFAIVIASPAHADVNFGALERERNIVTVTTGAEYGLLLGAGYARILSFAGRPILLGGDLSLGFAEVDDDDFRLRTGALVPVFARGHWKVIGGLTGTVRGTNNDIARMINVGADISLLAGRYSHRWFVAAELGFDWAITTHVEHDDSYRMNVFAEARDGWYGNSSGILRAGVQSGVTFGRYDLILRAGRLLDDSQMIPIYATLAIDRRW
jgi:hypothetical protein